MLRSIEEQLKRKLAEEATSRLRRKQEVESLTSQLDRSMARKQEVEDVRHDPASLPQQFTGLCKRR
jgi:hypothetical protein